MLDRPRNLQMQGQAPSPYMPDMGPEDYAPPEYRLVQAPSRSHTEADIPLGSYYCEQTGEATSQLDLVILKVQRNRTYWVSGDLSFPACSSDDRIMPRPGGLYQGPCETCEVNGRGCYPGYNLFCVRLDQQGKPEASEMFLIRANGTSVFPFRKLWSRIHLSHQDKPWSIAINLTSEKRSNDKGTYWVMQPNIAQEFTYQADLDLLKSLADELASPLKRGRMTQETEAMQQHRQPVEATVYTGPDQPTAPAITRGGGMGGGRASTSSKRPPITLEQAQEVVMLCEKLGVPPETVTSFINNTFGKNRVRELHEGEWEMLKKWLVQQFDQTKETGLDGDPIDSLPF